MGEIEDAVRLLWVRIHNEHPGVDLFTGECKDCPSEKARREHEAFKESSWDAKGES